MDLMPDTTKGKSFWSTKEGKFGMFFLGLLGLGGLFALDKILPFLIRIAQNTLHLFVLLGVLGALTYIVLDPKFRNLIWFLYRSAMRSIVGAFVVIDPIGILKNYVEYMKKNLGMMQQQISNLRGTLRTLQNKILSNNEKMQDELAKASIASKENNVYGKKLSEREAARLVKSNKNLEQLVIKIEAIYRNLQKLYEVSNFYVQDTENEVKMREDERKAVLSGYSAMRSAMSILRGDKDKKEMYDMAMQHVIEDVGMKVGEMEDFMELSQGIITHMDMENGVLDERGAKLLENWEKQESLLLGEEKKTLISYAENPSMKLDLEGDPIPAVSSRPDKYKKLFP